LVASAARAWEVGSEYEGMFMEETGTIDRRKGTGAQSTSLGDVIERHDWAFLKKRPKHLRAFRRKYQDITLIDEQSKLILLVIDT